MRQTPHRTAPHRPAQPHPAQARPPPRAPLARYAPAQARTVEHRAPPRCAQTSTKPASPQHPTEPTQRTPAITRLAPRPASLTVQILPSARRPRLTGHSSHRDLRVSVTAPRREAGLLTPGPLFAYPRPTSAVFTYLRPMITPVSQRMSSPPVSNDDAPPPRRDRRRPPTAPPAPPASPTPPASPIPPAPSTPSTLPAPSHSCRPVNAGLCARVGLMVDRWEYPGPPNDPPWPAIRRNPAAAPPRMPGDQSIPGCVHAAGPSPPWPTPPPPRRPSGYRAGNHGGQAATPRCGQRSTVTRNPPRPSRRTPRTTRLARLATTSYATDARDHRLYAQAAHDHAWR